MIRYSISGVVNQNLFALMEVETNNTGFFRYVYWLIFFTPI